MVTPGGAIALGPRQYVTITLPNPAAIGQWAQQLYNEAHDAKGKKGKTLRGGKKSQRDNWYGKNDPNFQRWWHREGKEEFGGNDIDNAAEAQEAWDHWNGLGRPTVK